MFGAKEDKEAFGSHTGLMENLRNEDSFDKMPDPSAQPMSITNKPNLLEVDEFSAILREIINLKASKSGDYASSWRALGMKGLLYQIARKFTRIWINKDKSQLNNETFRDSLIDLAIYSIMAIQLIDDKDTSDKIDDVLAGKKI